MDALAHALASLEAAPPRTHRAHAAARSAALERAWWAGGCVWSCPGPHGPLFHRRLDHAALQRVRRCLTMEMEP